MNSYHSAVMNMLQELESNETQKLKAVAAVAARTIETGNILFVFGSGHSSMLAEEAFHRAGGLIPVHPIMYPFLSPQTSPKVAGKLERLEGLAAILFARSGIRVGDLLFMASNSGVNAVAIEMALEAKKAGVTTVGFTSLKHSQNTRSRHSSGKRMFELVDHVIDNHCPAGDALVPVGSVQVAPGSTIANAWIWNSLVTEVAQILESKGKILPIYRSANLAGGDAHNEAQEKIYLDRIPLL